MLNFPGLAQELVDLLAGTGILPALADREELVGLEAQGVTPIVHQEPGAASHQRPSQHAQGCLRG